MQQTSYYDISYIVLAWCFFLSILLLPPVPRFQWEDDDEYDDQQDDDPYAGPFPRVLLKDLRLLEEICSFLNMFYRTFNLSSRGMVRTSGTNWSLDTSTRMPKIQSSVPAVGCCPPSHLELQPVRTSRGKPAFGGYQVNWCPGFKITNSRKLLIHLDVTCCSSRSFVSISFTVSCRSWISWSVSSTCERGNFRFNHALLLVL